MPIFEFLEGEIEVKLSADWALKLDENVYYKRNVLPAFTLLPDEESNLPALSVKAVDIAYENSCNLFLLELKDYSLDELAFLNDLKSRLSKQIIHKCFGSLVTLELINRTSTLANFNYLTSLNYQIEISLMVYPPVEASFISSAIRATKLKFHKEKLETLRTKTLQNLQKTGIKVKFILIENKTIILE